MSGARIVLFSPKSKLGWSRVKIYVRGKPESGKLKGKDFLRNWQMPDENT